MSRPRETDESDAPPDQAARERALDIRQHALVVAPAGSGKTSLLVARALKCLAVANEPEEVVAITFTNKAAAEIRTRLVEALHCAQQPPPGEAHARALHDLARQVLDRAETRGWHLLENPNRLRAVTIDALNAELAGRLPLLSGLGGPARMSEDSHGLFQEAIQTLFAQIEEDSLDAEDHTALCAVLRWEDNRLDRLIKPLASMLEKREQWLVEVMAQHDSGYDSRLLAALVQSRIEALHTLLDAPIRGELMQLLREGSAQCELLVWAVDLAGWPVSARQLRLCQQLAACLVTDKGTLRKAGGINKTRGFLEKQNYTRRMKALLNTLAEHPRALEIAGACAALASCPDPVYPEHLRRQRDALIRVLRQLTAHLWLVFSRRGEADFTEVGQAALKALRGEHGYSEVLERADSRIRHLLVDEMQDTSQAQMELLCLLTSAWIPDDGHSLFMVGDPQQSIYAFRKAEVRLFQEIWDQKQLQDNVPLACIRLSTNFRSQAALIDWFNHGFSRLLPAHADIHAGAVAYSACEAAPKAPRLAQPAVTVVPLDAENASAEASAVVARVQALLQQGEGKIAILARSRVHLLESLAELRRQDVRYHCQDIDPLSQVPAVREYLHLLRALWHPQDRLAWAVLLRSPLVGMSYADLVLLSAGAPKLPWPEKIRRALAAEVALSAEGQRRLQNLHTVLENAERDVLLYGDLPARSEAVWHALGGPACVTLTELADVQVAMRHVRAAAASGEIDSLAVLERSLARIYASPAAGQVQVLTAHKSKGLEFDHVLLVGCGSSTRSDERPALHYYRSPEGVLLVPEPPAHLAEDDPAHRLYDFVQGLQAQVNTNELKRLLYVCCTRARASLTLFMNLGFDKTGQPQPRAGSFAGLLWPVIAADCAQLVPSQDEATPAEARVPLSPRLPLDYRFVADDAALRPRERRSVRPSEAVLEAQEIRLRDGDLRARLVGVMFHEAMRRIAADGLQSWQDAGRSRRAAMAAGFRHLGLPEPEVAAAVERVLLLLERTLASEHGRWLLAARPWSHSEYALAGYREGQWVAGIVDRCFEEDGITWVIDYKTGGETAADARERHAFQVSQYAGLLTEIRGQPVRAALFLAESAGLVEL